jgi:hypothetical protein
MYMLANGSINYSVFIDLPSCQMMQCRSQCELLELHQNLCHVPWMQRHLLDPKRVIEWVSQFGSVNTTRFVMLLGMAISTACQQSSTQLASTDTYLTGKSSR